MAGSYNLALAEWSGNEQRRRGSFRELPGILHCLGGSHLMRHEFCEFMSGLAVTAGPRCSAIYAIS